MASVPGTDIDALLNTYPRPRPKLPPAHEAIYAREYKLNRDGAAFMEGLSKKVEGWMHRRVAEISGGPVLEVGAGNLNHLKFEADIGEYDAVEPFDLLYRDSPALASVRRVYAGVEDVPPGNRYERIVSVAVLEHLEDLPAELARCCLLLEKGGVFQAGIPSEGGLLWWLGWRGTTGLTYFLRNRLDFGVVMRHEHLNSAREIIAVVRALFADVTVRRFPLPHHHLSLYGYIEARRPDLDLARDILAQRGAATAGDAAASG